ncbi:hypothetical protein BJ912DRAFT_1114560 [Pholiota molesta]|nr:hypothetical protein BJ912DRAFT_1114560 [Pholiota molesta]
MEKDKGGRGDAWEDGGEWTIFYVSISGRLRDGRASRRVTAARTLKRVHTFRARPDHATNFDPDHDHDSPAHTKATDSPKAISKLYDHPRSLQSDQHIQLQYNLTMQRSASPWLSRILNIQTLFPYICGVPMLQYVVIVASLSGSHLFMATGETQMELERPRICPWRADNGWMVPYKRVLRWEASYFPSSAARMIIGGVECFIILAFHFAPDGTSGRGPLELPPRRIHF